MQDTKAVKSVNVHDIHPFRQGLAFKLVYITIVWILYFWPEYLTNVAWFALYVVWAVLTIGHLTPSFRIHTYRTSDLTTR